MRKTIFETNKKGPVLVGDSVVTAGLITGAAVAATAGIGYVIWNWWRKHKDGDNDGIPDYDEINKYHTDPNKPNYTFGYALKKLPES